MAKIGKEIPNPQRSIRIRMPSAEVEYHGPLAELRTELPQLLEQVALANNQEVRAGLMQGVGSLQAELARLDASHGNSVRLEENLAALANRLSQAVERFTRGTDGEDMQQLLTNLQGLRDDQISFNLQYLQLQSEMQNEDREYTAVSNIMKTKHDTVKNLISNIR